MKRILIISPLIILLFSSGCTFLKNTAANLKEAPRIVWGSSTRALENARTTAVSKAFACSFEECFDAVVAMAVEEGEEEEEVEEEAAAAEEGEIGLFGSVDLLAGQGFKIFINNPRKKMLVIYNIPGSVDTTEVGVFFNPSEDNSLAIEISSLSTHAKQTAARLIFERLATQYTEVVQ